MLNYAKAIGANTDYLTAQAFVFQGPSPNQLLVLVLAGIAEDGFSKIRKVGLEAEELFFSVQESVADRFEKLNQLIKDELKDFEKIEGVISFVDESSLYLQTIGNFDVLLSRQGERVNLTDTLESQKLISGLLELGDKVLFLSPALTEETDSRSFLIDSLLKSDLESIEFEVEAFLQPLPKSDPIAAVVVESFQPAEEQQQQKKAEFPIFHPALQAVGPSTNRRFPKIQLPSRLTLPKLSFRRLLVLILVLIVGGFVFYNYGQKQQAKDKLFASQFSQAQQNLDKAISLKDSDQPQARQLLTQAQNNLKQALAVKPKDKAALDFQIKLQDQSYQILKQFQVNDFPVFLDLNLIKQGFSSSRLSHSLNKIGLLDKNDQTLVSLVLDQKLPKVLAGSMQLGEAQFASINGDNLFVYSKDKGILTVDLGNGKITSPIKPDPDWQKVVDIYGFANNVYLLDEFKNQIWKYIATTNGLSEKNSYLKEDVKADFAGARSLQIDGAVWVLKSEKNILKFIQGGEDFFALQNFPQEINQIKSFFTSDETQSIYLLDNENSRVVLAKKNGEYLGEYTGEKFKSADDLIVDEKGKKMYLLEGNKVYLVELK